MKLTLVLLFACLAIDFVFAAPQEKPNKEVDLGTDCVDLVKALKTIAENGLSILKLNHNDAFPILAAESEDFVNLFKMAALLLISIEGVAASSLQQYEEEHNVKLPDFFEAFTELEKIEGLPDFWKLPDTEVSENEKIFVAIMSFIRGLAEKGLEEFQRQLDMEMTDILKLLEEQLPNFQVPHFLKLFGRYFYGVEPSAEF